MTHTSSITSNWPIQALPIVQNKKNLTGLTAFTPKNEKKITTNLVKNHVKLTKNDPKL